MKKEKETSMRIWVSARKAVKDLIEQNPRLRLTASFSNGILRTVKERPDFFLSENPVEQINGQTKKP